MANTSFTIGGKKATRPAEVSLRGELFAMAGPCVIEGRTECVEIAQRLMSISDATGVPIVFKASFDKANRSSSSSFRGPGLKKGLQILNDVREQTGLPVITDIHESTQAAPAAEVVDCLQVPAFLCRQTDLLIACAETGLPINVKKGQFMSPEEMRNVVEKITETGNNKVMLTERGTFFGYNRLVNDMTSISAMQQLGCPVIFDATHSTQRPGGLGVGSGGDPGMTPPLAFAAVAAGADGLFLEVHQEPSRAKSDAACMLPVEQLEDVLRVSKQIFEVVHDQ